MACHRLSPGPDARAGPCNAFTCKTEWTSLVRQAAASPDCWSEACADSVRTSVPKAEAMRQRKQQSAQAEIAVASHRAKPASLSRQAEASTCMLSC